MLLDEELDFDWIHGEMLCLQVWMMVFFHHVIGFHHHDDDFGTGVTATIIITLVAIEKSERMLFNRSRLQAVNKLELEE